MTNRILMRFVAIQVQLQRVGNLLHFIMATLVYEIGNEWLVNGFLYHRHGQKTYTPKIASLSSGRKKGKCNSTFGCIR
jgi:hypothetical protein